MWAATDGEIHPDRESRVPPDSLSARYGLNLFETLRTMNGEMLFWERHKQRMVHSAKQLEFPQPDALAGVQGVVRTLLARNALDEGRIRVVLHLLDEDRAMLSIQVQPVPEYPDLLRLTWADFPRNERSPLVRVKCGNYAEHFLAWARARSEGFDESIFLNGNGEVTEGTRSNIFLVRDDQILTPPTKCGLLPGITREIVLEIAGATGLDVCEQVLHRDDFEGDEEIFLTNSVMGILPGLFTEKEPQSPLMTSATTQRLQSAYHEKCAG